MQQTHSCEIVDPEEYVLRRNVERSILSPALLELPTQLLPQVIWIL